MVHLHCMQMGVEGPWAMLVGMRAQPVRVLLTGHISTLCRVDSSCIHGLIARWGPGHTQNAQRSLHLQLGRHDSIWVHPCVHLVVIPFRVHGPLCVVLAEVPGLVSAPQVGSMLHGWRWSTRMALGVPMCMPMRPRRLLVQHWVTGHHTHVLEVVVVLCVGVAAIECSEVGSRRSVSLLSHLAWGSDGQPGYWRDRPCTQLVFFSRDQCLITIFISDCRKNLVNLLILKMFGA
mmetsp:Transcript_13073/g.16768  ORF Transcript_13073/g.16768 Transcript_13073/m.16768 type:complete len:233 (+) Transcript_13073:1907-2605(+)